MSEIRYRYTFYLLAEFRNPLNRLRTDLYRRTGSGHLHSATAIYFTCGLNFFPVSFLKNT